MKVAVVDENGKAVSKLNASSFAAYNYVCAEKTCGFVSALLGYKDWPSVEEQWGGLYVVQVQGDSTSSASAIALRVMTKSNPIAQVPGTSINQEVDRVQRQKALIVVP